MATKAILLEDDDNVARGLRILLENEGFEVECFPARAQAFPPDGWSAVRVLICDAATAPESAIDAVVAARLLGYAGMVVFLTEGDGFDAGPFSDLLMPFHVMAVPFDPDHLLETLQG